MVFTYTEIFKAASPLRGGTAVSSMAGGNFGETVGAMAAGSGLISTTLASVKMVLINTYNMTISGGAVLSISSNGMIDIGANAACSGTWAVFGY